MRGETHKQGRSLRAIDLAVKLRKIYCWLHQRDRPDNQHHPGWCYNRMPYLEVLQQENCEGSTYVSKNEEIWSINDGQAQVIQERLWALQQSIKKPTSLDFLHTLNVLPCRAWPHETLHPLPMLSWGIAVRCQSHNVTKSNPVEVVSNPLLRGIYDKWKAYISPTNGSDVRLEYIDERFSKRSSAVSISLIITIVVPRALTELMGPVIHSKPVYQHGVRTDSYHTDPCVSPRIFPDPRRQMAYQAHCQSTATAWVQEEVVASAS